MGSYREEFERTESILTRHRAATKERLMAVIMNGIVRLRSNEWELNKMPPELREEFLNLMSDLTEKDGDPLKEKTAIHVTVEAMTEGEAELMADRILALCDLIEHLHRGKEESD